MNKMMICPKYKECGGPITALNIYANGNKTGCFLDHFASLLRELSPGFLNVHLDFDKLIAWAEKNSERIKWLLDKGYIEEVQSELSKWEKECPIVDKDGYSYTRQIIPLVIEWAKRMPRDVSADLIKAAARLREEERDGLDS